MGRPRKNALPAAAPKKIFALEGLSDVTCETNPLWDMLLKKLARINRIYGFSRCEPPLLEDMFLYSNFYNANAAVLESLVLTEGAGKSASIRPACLPSVLRAYAQAKVFDQYPLSKWSYEGLTVKRAAGGKRLRQDYEFGFEVFGNFNHLTEAQVVGALWEFLMSVGIKDMTLEINNIGNPVCQASYQETLSDFLAGKKYALCDECNDHLQGRILNVFRCGNLDCQTVLSEAPTILDYLDNDSHKHFTSILEALDELGVPYQLNPLYAGPNGHSETNFVVKCKLRGETVVIGEGGYHEQLMENICGKPHCCFGFSGSLSALCNILEANKVLVSKEVKSDVFLVPLGELASKKSLRLFKDLTTERISVYDHFGSSGVKNQLKAAETYKAPIALIMGQKEAMDEMVILRDVKSGMQEIISYDKIVEEVKKRLGR
jgi:histidyl-tRNA synthetase